MTNPDRNTHPLWIVAAILLLAFGLRLYGLGTESLWYDETVSVHLAGKSLPALVAHTAGDIHPPGYYLLLHAWTRLAGSSEFATAFLSLFFGVLLVALAYWLGKRVFGRRAGVLAALVVAISPYNIWYSQEVRMYTLGAVLGIGVLGATICLLSQPAARRPAAVRWLTIYAVCGALGLWTVYYFAFLLVAVNLMAGLWWLVGWRRGRVGWAWLGRWALAQAAVVLLYAPWLPAAWRQATEPPVPPWRAFTALTDVVVEAWTALCLGQSVEAARVWPALLLCAALLVLGLVSTRLSPRLRGEGGADGALPWLLAGAVFLPVGLIYLASYVTPLYHVRYVFTYAIPVYLLIGAGVAWLWGWWRPLAWASLAVLTVYAGISLYAYHTDPIYAGDDHRAAAEFLAERWRPGDAILVNAGYAYPALVTYWRGDPIAWRGRLVDGGLAEGTTRGPIVFQTGAVDGEPTLGWGDPDSDFYAMSQAEAADALTRLFAEFDRVWVYRIYDTVTDPDGFLRRWLDEHGTPFEDQVFSGEGQLRVQGFLTGRDPLAGTQPADAALADGSLRLVGTPSIPQAVDVGGTLDLAPVWQVASAPAEGAILFAGLFDGTGQRWAQTDERPLGTLYPATAWPEGATVRTPLRIAVTPGTPPGRYQVELGWYRFVDGQPVWLPWTTGERLALGEVEVVPPTDWSALPLPAATHPVDVTIGDGVQLLGFDAQGLEAVPGQSLSLDLLWQALEDRPEAGPVVLQLQDDEGQVLAESASAPAEGRLPFSAWATGQTVRDLHSLSVPGGLTPGVYNVVVGRRRADGSWLAVRRGPIPLGSTYPLATIRVLGRPIDQTPPAAQHPADARFGEGIGLAGYDLPAPTFTVEPTLYWQALAPMTTSYKIFLHLVGAGGPADVRAQADVYPHLPTTAWLPGEYLSDRIALELPADLPRDRYTLLLGWYDGATGQRLPVFDGSGTLLGDSLELAQLDLGE